MPERPIGRDGMFEESSHRPRLPVLYNRRRLFTSDRQYQRDKDISKLSQSRIDRPRTRSSGVIAAALPSATYMFDMISWMNELCYIAGDVSDLEVACPSLYGEMRASMLVGTPGHSRLHEVVLISSWVLGWSSLS